MKKVNELIKSPHIQIALATGVSIIVMAYVSKKLLPKPIGYIPLSIPPFIALIYETILDRYKNSWFCETKYWIAAVLISTVIIILSHAI